VHRSGVAVVGGFKGRRAFGNGRKYVAGQMKILTTVIDVGINHCLRIPTLKPYVAPLSPPQLYRAHVLLISGRDFPALLRK
jgi:hypothetical protein